MTERQAGSGGRLVGALGLAVLTTIATTRTNGLLVAHHPIDQALTLGFHLGFYGASAFVLVALLAALAIGTGRITHQRPVATSATEALDPVDPAVLDKAA